MTLTLLLALLAAGHSAHARSSSAERATASLERQIVSRLARVEGRVGVYYEDLTSGERVLINADAVFGAASTMKLLVMAKVFRDVEDGRYRLDQRVPVRDTFPSLVGWTEPIVCPAKVDEMRDAVGGRMSVRELLHWMIAESDNLATNVLMELAGGPSAVRSYADGLGLPRSRIVRYLMDGAALRFGVRNLAQPLEYGRFLAALWREAIISPMASRGMLRVMKEPARWWLASRVPRRVKVYHKTGAVRGLRHDAAIFRLPSGRAWVLVYFSDGLRSHREGQKAMNDVGRMVWQHVARRDKEAPDEVAASPDPPPTRSDERTPGALEPIAWDALALRFVDTERLARRFEDRRYSPPVGSRVIAAVVEPGVGQPAFHYFALGPASMCERCLSPPSLDGFPPDAGVFCKGEGCDSPFELHDVLRRAVLHEELPAAERLPLAPAERKRVVDRLTATSLGLTLGPYVRLRFAFAPQGDSADPGPGLVEHVWAVHPATGRRFLITAAMASRHGPDSAETGEAMRQLLRGTLDALVDARPPTPALQTTHGAALAPRWQRAAGGASELLVSVRGVERLTAWADGVSLGPATAVEGGFRFAREIPRRGEVALYVEGFRGDARVEVWAGRAVAGAVARDR